jgi:hypothetical protein
VQAIALHLRKSIVSLQREESHSAVSAPQLAKQMGHSLSMAQQYYHTEASQYKLEMPN